MVWKILIFVKFFKNKKRMFMKTYNTNDKLGQCFFMNIDHAYFK